MKILVISDLHGRDELLRKAAVLHTDRDGILFLGDGARDIDVDALTVGGRFFAGVREIAIPFTLRLKIMILIPNFSSISVNII